MHFTIEEVSRIKSAEPVGELLKSSFVRTLVVHGPTSKLFISIEEIFSVEILEEGGDPPLGAGVSIVLLGHNMDFRSIRRTSLQFLSNLDGVSQSTPDEEW